MIGYDTPVGSLCRRRDSIFVIVARYKRYDTVRYVIAPEFATSVGCKFVDFDAYSPIGEETQVIWRKHS